MNKELSKAIEKMNAAHEKALAKKTKPLERVKKASMGGLGISPHIGWEASKEQGASPFIDPEYRQAVSDFLDVAEPGATAEIAEARAELDAALDKYRRELTKIKSELGKAITKDRTVRQTYQVIFRDKFNKVLRTRPMYGMLADSGGGLIGFLGDTDPTAYCSQIRRLIKDGEKLQQEAEQREAEAAAKAEQAKQQRTGA